MAFVRTFVVYDNTGVPDNLIREWLSPYEKHGPLRLSVTPIKTKTASLINVIATYADTWESMEIDPTKFPVQQRPFSTGVTGNNDEE